MGRASGITTGRKLSKNQRLVFDFFRTFARFEYALKEAGFVKPQVNAEPDWDVFTNSIEENWESVLASEEIRAARDYLLQHPPMKQVVQDGGLGWTELVRGNEREVRFVVRSVKTIRNNLFHGGKRMKLSPERDKILITSALRVLNILVELDPRVKHYFEDGV